ncbi:MAG: hypothetical protein JNL11_06560 [Bdellovibrionaceae bacterium]|nr:hypothetical protein [Pseudobdellovibrionaceae bacterium]
MKILLALFFLLVGGALAWLSLNSEDRSESSSEASSHNSNTLQMLLIADLKKAAQAKELPAFWDQVLEVRYIYHSQRVHRILGNNPVMAINKKGGKRLLVEFFDEPGAADIVMVRYNLVDIVSGNTVGEMNRRLQLPTSLYTPPDANASSTDAHRKTVPALRK